MNPQSVASAVRIVFFGKSQLSLFEEIRPVKGTVDKHGHVRKPHFAVRHVAKESVVEPQASLFDDAEASQPEFHLEPDSQKHQAVMADESAEYMPSEGAKRELRFLIEHKNMAATLMGIPENDRKDFIHGVLLGLDQQKPPAKSNSTLDQGWLLGTENGNGNVLDEPKEGDTRVENRVTYRLQDGRWHRVDKEEKEEPKGEFVTPPKLDLPTVEHDGDTWYVQNTGAARADGKVLAHLSSATRGRPAKNGVHSVQMQDYLDRDRLGMVAEVAPELIDYTTRKGKVIRGIVRKDLTQAEAKEIDEYTFRLNGGWFIREKHLKEGDYAAPATESNAAANEFTQEEHDAAIASLKEGMVIHQHNMADSVTGIIEKITDPIEYNGAAPSRRQVQIRWADDGKKRTKIGAFISQFFMRDGKLYTSGMNDAYPPEEWTVVKDAKPATKAKKTPAKEPITQKTVENPVSAAEIETLGGVDYSLPFNDLALSANEFGVKPGVSKPARRELNKAAADLVNSDRETFTDSEKELLRQYSGWGGCGQSLNEFYTSVPIAGAMWKALNDLGALVPGATALEPSCGTGVFLHLAPAGVKVTGVELDATSAKIAKVLHGDRHEIVNSGFERFATTDDRQFDVVIGNPPYGPRGEVVSWDKPDISRAEQYFVDTSMDKCNDGGIVALVLPTGIVDNMNARWLRESMLRKGEFMGAIRMPNTAFEASHTEVTTDVVFLKKRDNDVAQALGTVDKATLKTLGVWNDDFLAGTYFTEGSGKDNVLGVLEEGWRAKAGIGNDITVTGSMLNVPNAIAGFTPEDRGEPLTLSRVLDALTEDGKAKALNAAKSRPYMARVGDMKEIDGVTYVLQGKPPRWHRLDEVVDNAKVGQASALATRIEALANWREHSRPLKPEEIESFKTLGDDIRAYMAQYGNPNKDADLLMAAKADRVLYRMMGAVGLDGKLSDLVEGRKAERIAGSFESAVETLSAEVGNFTAKDVADRWGKGDEAEALDHLYASPSYSLNTDGTWVTADNYLSGELWPKLDAVNAKLAETDIPEADRLKYQGQAQALEAAIEPAILDDVDIRLNDAWLPVNVIEAWFNDRLRAEAENNQYMRSLKPVEIRFDKGVYTVTGGNSYQMDKFAMFLNRSGLRRDDRPMIDTWNEEFKSWLCGSEYRGAMEDLYNRKFKGFVAKTFSKEPFDIPGMDTEGLKDYQYPGLRWALAAGKGIIAADVGLGKTARGLMLARMLKVSGRSQRPVIVVPKSVLANWAAEAEKWFPGSKVAVIGETYTKAKDGSLVGKVDNAAERNRKLHDILQNEYDFILVSRDAFNDIDLSPVEKGQQVERDFWTQRGDSLGNKGDKQLNDIRTRHNQAAAGMDFRKRSDALWFDELGVDGLIIDEAHAYKNLWAAKARFGDTPKFLGGQGQSKRARDMFYKTQWLRSRTDGKNVYGLTATPTKNSPLEIYSMLSHVAPEAFEQIGIRNSEEFLDRFCKFATEFYLDPTTQTMKKGEVVDGFKNLSELRGIMSRYIDRTTADMVGLKLPSKDERDVLVDMSKGQVSEYDRLREMAEEATKQDAAEGESHIFSIMDKMAKAATDLELLDPVKYKGAKSPKLEAAAKNIIAGVKEGGQVVFCDYIATHTKLADMVAAMGIPRDQIAIINAKEAEDSADRQNIADAFNAGKIKVVIGNTATMGEGINLQHGTTDIHHIDLPWEPASVQQRNGRGVRQGNKAEAVRIHTYMVKGTFDAIRWNAVAAKKDWQDLLWNGGDNVDNLGKQKFSSDEMKIMLSADPEEARKQFEDDKAAANERYRADQRQDAANQFRRFREVQASFASLKDKGTKTAQALSVRMESMKSNLMASPYFSDKTLLDSETPAIIHPKSGQPFYTGRAFEMASEDGSVPGSYVVTGVGASSKGQYVKVRKFGESVEMGYDGSPRYQVIDLEKLGNVTTHEHSEKAEGEYVQRKMEESIKDGQAAITNPKQTTHLSAETATALYDQLQSQMRDSFLAYKDGWRGEFVPLVNHETGEVKSVSSYNARKEIENGMHLVLPSLPKHREAAMNAFIEQERGKYFTKTTVQKRRGGRTDWQKVVRYPGGYDVKSNTWSVAKDLWGEDFMNEAKARFKAEQIDRVKSATSTADSVREIAPLLAPDNAYSTQGAIWTKDLLGVMYAKAKANGDLDAPTRNFVSASSIGKTGDVPAWIFGGGDYGPEQTETLRTSLQKLAKDHADMASVIVVDDPSKTPAEKIRRLAQIHKPRPGYYDPYDYEPAVLDAMRHVIEKHPEAGDMLVSDAIPVSHEAKNVVFGAEVRDLPLREALKRIQEVNHD